MHWNLISLVLAAMLPSVLSGQCKSSTQGQEFVFGILDTFTEVFHDSRNIVALDITNVSPKDVRVRFQIPFFNNDTYFNIPHGEKKTISIDPLIQKDGSFVDKRGIRISSDSDISMLVTNAFGYEGTIESYNIFPVDALGNKYIISSFKSTQASPYRNTSASVFLVAGVYDNTQIMLYNRSSQIYSRTINSNDVFQYICSLTCDLTALQVISDKNVYITAGSTLTYIPEQLNGTSWESIGAAMIPTSAWSNKYIVPPVLPKRAFMIRVLSEHSSLNATVSNSTKTFSASASLTEYYFENETVVVVADQSFSVTQYGVNSQYDIGDAFMTIVPSVDQYINNYTFTVPQGYYHVRYYMAVIVQDMYKDGLLFDNIPRHSYKYPIKRVKVPSPLSEYIVLTFKVDTGFHNFRQSLPEVNFGLFVYGLGEYGLGSGFYAGMNLAGDCITSSVTTKMTPSTEKTSAGSTHSKFSTSSITAVTPAVGNGTGQMCFVCSDLSHHYLCDRVERCSQNEVCFLERYMESGHIKYKSGCMEDNTCRIKQGTYLQSDAVCFECCHGDFCNNQGCREVIPERERRGPICFDCEHVATPDECFKVFPCNPDQVCRIEEYSWFGDSNFKMGCGQGACDPVVRSVSHIFKRAVPVCHSCCTADFCNRNCTQTAAGQAGPAIVG